MRYEVDTSKNDFDEIITLSNPDDSGSDNLGSDAEWDEEVPEITHNLACKIYTEDQDKLEETMIYAEQMVKKDTSMLLKTIFY